jgi:hypothetical protein
LEFATLRQWRRSVRLANYTLKANAWGGARGMPALLVQARVEDRMVPTVSQIKDQLADREAIKDCLYRYSRGIDRCDMELLRSAYWPGAIDTHTGFKGTIEEFIAWAEPRLRAMEQSMHMIGNIFLRLDGDKACGEAYFWSVAVIPGAVPRAIVACGRYLDRFERRKEQWRIAERLVAHDWFCETTQTGDWSVGPFGLTGLERGAGMAQDKSYTWLNLR